MRRTKIIATVGPASDTGAELDALIAAGVDVFRLNFAHGTHASHAASIAAIRRAAGRAGREVAILQDLAGPKIRTGRLAGGSPIDVARGDPLRIAIGDGLGTREQLFTAFAGLAEAVRAGDRLLLADGAIELRVDASDPAGIRTTVVEGGRIGEHKGINAPGVALPVAAVTARDADDLAFGAAHGVDLVAISFVQSAADVRRVRGLLEAQGRSLPVVAKLERPEALANLALILDACDGVMVARGDLGLEIPLEQVPRAQKSITLAALGAGKPVIVATQVLESMTRAARPTRAEVSDAANAVDDGVDAIMLAGETAVGAAPAHVAATLDAIIRDAESAPDPGTPIALRREARPDDHAFALCMAAVTLAERGAAHGIVAVTRTGRTAQRLSMLRPKVPILAASDRVDTARRLSLLWGVAPFHMEVPPDRDPGAIGRQMAAQGRIPPGAAVVLVNIHPDATRPDANYLRLQQF
ncbi:MAG: pyruvate kinase [Acidobacteria bacterium]|nr:pyruvate kinase [Acidobacteriota bacterium]